MAEAEGFVDDPIQIPDDALLLRRVDWDKAGGKTRVPVGERAKMTGNFFTDYPEGKALELGYPGACMSVGLLHEIERRGLDAARAMLQGFEGYGLVAVRAGALRSLVRANGDPCPQGIMPAPTAQEPWHAVVFDLERRPRQKPATKRIAEVAEWVVPLVRDA